MAQPILLELPHPDRREALYDQLKAAPREHAEALLNVYQILRELQDRGVLELAKGALGSSEKVLQIAVNIADQPEMIQGIRNMMILTKTVGSLDPELLESVGEALQGGLAEARGSRPPGLLQLLIRLLSKESRRVLVMATSILKAVGKKLDQNSRS
jgi:uncharacterized protein YjgD (DUF1641 family)